MKKLCLLIAVVIIAGACRKDNAEVKPVNLAGSSWAMITNDDVALIRFTNDTEGQLQEVVPQGGDNMDFTYTKTGNNVQINIENGYLRPEISGDKMVIKGADGSVLTFNKISGNHVSLNDTSWIFSEDPDIINLFFNKYNILEMRLLLDNKISMGELFYLPLGDTIYISGGSSLHKAKLSGNELTYIIDGSPIIFSRLLDVPPVAGTKWSYSARAIRYPFDSSATVQFLPNNVIDELIKHGDGTYRAQYKYVRQGSNFYYSSLAFVNRFQLQANSLLYTSYDGKNAVFAKQ